MVGRDDFEEQRQRIEANKFLKAIRRSSACDASTLQVMAAFLQLYGGGATEDEQRAEGQPSPVAEDGQITAFSFLIACVAVMFGACLIFSGL